MRLRLKRAQARWFGDIGLAAGPAAATVAGSARTEPITCVTTRTPSTARGTRAPATGAYANNYGTWLCGNGRAAESLAWFEKAIADPNYPTRAAALANAGTCANRAGQPEQAEANWRQALAMDPGELQSLAGMAALQFARGRYLEARAFAERWLALSPVDAEGLQLASSIEQKLGDNVAAQRYLSRLQAIPSGSPTAPRAQ